MKLISTICLFLFTLSLSAQSREFKDVEIASSISKQKLQFQLSLPRSYAEQSEKRYPVFITTAGMSRLEVVKAQVDWLSHVDFAPIPEVILISMPDIKLEGLKDKFDSAAGNGDELTAKVLIEELLPYVDAHYRTTGYRVIEGFSSFGNFPLYLLRHHSDAINAFLSFAPALELDKSGLVDSLSDDWSTANERSNYVYLTLGTFRGNRKYYEQLTESLTKVASKSPLKFEYADHSKENYLSGPNLGLIEASQSLFSDLQPDYKQFHEAGISGVESYFKQLSEKYHDNIDVRSKLIDLAFSYAYSDKLESATKVMEKVISENADNLLYRIRLAQIQVRAEDKTNALSTLKTALKLAEQKNDEEAISFIKRLAEDASGES